MLNETWLVFKRQVKATLRSPIWVIIGLFQPFCYLLLFAPLLDKLSGSPGFGAGNALATFVPGLLVMLTIFGVAFAGFSLLEDLRAGVVERLRVTGISPFAFALGSAARDVIMLLVQATILIGIALLMGMSANLGGLLLLLALLALTGGMLAAYSYALALVVKDENALASTINFFTVPLLLLSGVMLPLALAPDWLQTVAKANPFYHAVEGARALVAGDFGAGSIWIAFGLMTIFAFLTLRWCASAFSRATT